MIKKIFTLLTIICNCFIFAQVGMGTSNPDISSVLELSATNKGFLPPRIGLTSSTDAVTIPNPATGLIVYNTNTAFANAGLYLNIGTPTSPDWQFLQVQTPGGKRIEYTSLDISPEINMNTIPNADGIWKEVPALRQNLIVATGTDIKTVVTIILNSFSPSGGFAQCDVLVKITPDAPLAATLPSSGNPRDSFGSITNNGSGQSVSINIAKSAVATTSNYYIQTYIMRNNSPTNLTYYTLSPIYINTLATK